MDQPISLKQTKFDNSIRLEANLASHQANHQQPINLLVAWAKTTILRFNNQMEFQTQLEG